jgi:Cu-Zn family superoxide dismutase
MNRIIRSLVLPAVGLALASAGCESMPWNKNDNSDDMKKAVATIKPAKAASTRPAWGNPGGTVTFTDKGADKVRVEAKLTGLSPGEHGFHIHEKGDLSAADLASAGAHFNPAGHKHAGPKDASRHAGDLGNITADASGNAKLDITVDGISIGTAAANDILGKSVILHEKADDLQTNPSGNSGGRIGGGVIELKKAKKE